MTQNLSKISHWIPKWSPVCIGKKPALMIGICYGRLSSEPQEGKIKFSNHQVVLVPIWGWAHVSQLPHNGLFTCGRISWLWFDLTDDSYDLQAVLIQCGSNLIVPPALLSEFEWIVLQHYLMLHTDRLLWSPGSLVRPKVVRSVHYCPQTKKTLVRRYTDLTSLDAFPSSTVYPTKVSNHLMTNTRFKPCCINISYTKQHWCDGMRFNTPMQWRKFGPHVGQVPDFIRVFVHVHNFLKLHIASIEKT